MLHVIRGEYAAEGGIEDEVLPSVAPLVMTVVTR